jgi:hypothetical protein
VLSKDQVEAASDALVAPKESVRLKENLALGRFLYGDAELYGLPLLEQRIISRAVRSHWVLIVWAFVWLTSTAKFLYLDSRAALPVLVLGLAGFIGLRRTLLRRYVSKRAARAA